MGCTSLGEITTRTACVPSVGRRATFTTITSCALSVEGTAVNITPIVHVQSAEVQPTPPRGFHHDARPGHGANECYWVAASYSAGLRYPLRLRMRSPLWFCA
jgi:hypothetical protein